VQLEKQISAAKKLYAETLQNLEKISDDIHTQRRQERRREKKARKLANAAGNEMIIYHPLMDVLSSSSDEDSGNETSADADSAELAMPPLVGVVPVKNITVRQIDCIPPLNTSGQFQIAGAATVDAAKLPLAEGDTRLTSQQTVTSMDKPSTSVDAETGVDRATSLAESTSSPMSPESDIEQMQANAAVMVAISRSKLRHVASPFLRPDACREDLSLNGGSETESVSGSFVSGGIGTLDDEQIESLMVDVTEYQRIVDDMDAAESNLYQQMALPARLRHLQDFVKFEPVWIDDDADDYETVRTGHNDDVEWCDAENDDHVFNENDRITCVTLQSQSSDQHSTDVTSDSKPHIVACDGDDVWHPLIDNVTSTASSNGYE